jgi:hypothetical protein
LSEARLLRPGDVDIDAGVLRVRDAKGGGSADPVPAAAGQA